VVVRGPRLSLQILRPEHADSLYELGRDPEISRFFSWSPYEAVEEASSFIDSLTRQRETGHRYELGIFGNEGELLGITGFSDFSRRDRRAVLGTWLGRPHWGSGANRESKALVLALAFRALGLLRVTALASPQNVRSVAALQRLGFVHEGVLRGWHVHSGVPRDVAVLRMMRDEWERTPLAEVEVVIEGVPPRQFVLSGSESGLPRRPDAP
jgi:ribosomal-protein-alanine N-acetyltransferase